MAYVKLDCGMLDSTLWFDREAREVFITALLMAIPCKIEEPEPQLKAESLDPTGWEVPVGRYGFVEAAGVGIIRRAGVDHEPGIEALRRLSSPEESSRSPEFEGRRMARVDGGWLVLNFDKYRNKDHTAAARAKRYRERKRHGVSSIPHGVTPRDVTQAEAEAKAKEEHPPTPLKGGPVTRRRSLPKKSEVEAEIKRSLGKNTFGQGTPLP